MTVERVETRGIFHLRKLPHVHSTHSIGKDPETEAEANRGRIY